MLRFLLLTLLLVTAAHAQAPKPKSPAPKREPRELLPEPYRAYFTQRIASLSSTAWRNGLTAETWPAKQKQMRRELQSMLGLDPWPSRGDLKPVITGTVQGDGYVIEKLHFQSLPGLYVTANLYRPKEVTKPLPTILYVCGHSVVMEQGISMGNKTGYQHHGSWFARHGYVCLIIDTVQLGEIRGEHGGTHRLGRWWWPTRGYTPAGVEAWNSIRALDYLETRPEVDKERIGITGRSGGGAYSWFTAALDERIKVAVPAAGITTLSDHVLEGAIEGHCDCMFQVNSCGWEFDRLAALIAPRPLLIANTDKDPIFPMTGVMEIYTRTRELYRQLGAEANIGLQIAEGPHKDVQPLNVGAFAWMNRHLQGAKLEDFVDEPARKLHQPAELRVFTELPKDEINTKIDESFVTLARPVPAQAPREVWMRYREELLTKLRQDTFRNWPAAIPSATARKTFDATRDGVRLTRWSFVSQDPWQLELLVLQPADADRGQFAGTELRIMGNDEEWNLHAGELSYAFPAAKIQAPAVAPETAGEGWERSRQAILRHGFTRIIFAPRGVGPTSLAAFTETKRTHLLRRFHLLGESLESGQAWDIAQALHALSTISDPRLVLRTSLPGIFRTRVIAEGAMAQNLLYASLFTPVRYDLNLAHLPATHASGGSVLLNVYRYLDVPQAVALALEGGHRISLYDTDPKLWAYPKAVDAERKGERNLFIYNPVQLDGDYIEEEERAQNAPR